ncbi:MULTISPECIES: Na+/H+ antiporter [unclassified Mesorhizobium]|uniref:Na+/H+ antiporter n=1 Tax=unclassified Mesorhizobium TaxID=325217 RepID=UPI000FCBB12A|nr:MULTISPECIES: Na+/H+ antiporter [unclassified Mesorhizobium]RUW48250.1 Na+/H+ antiporter [Mesorhizobium sp. M8A.F.Ca.ET.021.01.1.1]TGP95961.1 Na+/H+ antiporter [Mesorhizobium sp. M8A.F.Ca.ET.218.01.1.1]TGS46068.1 Na+/H+ antiporter [Mesorhizobium sp. M8A.F.Ca.ET.182.01.1.1]TGS81525.1 Na+/H+ antiporter [Mesorhizobium sp. M8A.F.Ca.ET.181.01.1.1]TGT19013.1 Na+/H+ antiporter [Mesorhizobium sp. M8A.F.Ca.ET.213.01.1.1]
MDVALFILVVLVFVALSGALVRLVRVPLPVLQIAIGAALAWPARGLHVEIDPELFLLVFIPPLLFGDAFAAPKRELIGLRGPILDLAIGLVFFTIVGFGYALHWLVPSIPLVVAFALAAVLSPTDAVAVSSIVDRNVVPSRLMHILEGESLLNDASGLVMFRFAVAAALTGSFSLAGASLSFLYAVAAGILAGLAALFIAAKTLQLLNRIGGVPAEAQVLVMILLPFVAYLGAEHVGASGILAAVTAGLLTGVSGMYRHLGVSARMQTLSLWATLTFVFNGALFILLGLQLPDIIRKVPPELSSRHWLIEPVATVLILTLCLIGLRFLWIWVGDIAQAIAARLGKREASPFGFRVRLAGSVAGVRGAITLAGILSLPLALQDGSPFPARDVVIFLAAGVIICSLVIASFALPRIARGLVEPGEDPAAAEERRARVGAANAAIARIESIANEQGEGEAVEARLAVADSIVAGYRRRIAASDEAAEARAEAREAGRLELELRAAGIEAERSALRDMFRSQEINDHTMRALFSEITLTEALLKQRRDRK